MKKLVPYKSISEATLSLDNGGRFYNIMTKADDGQISTSELGKVAGLFHDKQRMILFFHLSISTLDQSKKAQVISNLDPGLKKLYDKFRPAELSIAEAHTNGVLASNTLVTGIPLLTESKTDFLGFIMIPISTGKVTTFTMIPLIDAYDVYEIRDQATDTNFLIAHAKGKNKLPAEKIKVAGILKELKANKKEKKASKKYLEVQYYV